MTTIEILDPAGQIQKRVPLQCTPIDFLTGRRIAILDNVKPNFMRLATLVAQRLQDDCGMKSIEYFRKANPSTAAGSVLLDRIVSSADLVLTGSAD